MKEKKKERRASAEQPGPKVRKTEYGGVHTQTSKNRDIPVVASASTSGTIAEKEEKQKMVVMSAVEAEVIEWKRLRRETRRRR